MTVKCTTKERKFGAICNAGGRTLEIISEHQLWLDWALDILYAAAKKDAFAVAKKDVAAKWPTAGRSVECPYCGWGFDPSVIKQHLSEKH